MDCYLRWKIIGELYKSRVMIPRQITLCYKTSLRFVCVDTLLFEIVYDGFG